VVLEALILPIAKPSAIVSTRYNIFTLATMDLLTTSHTLYKTSRLRACEQAYVYLDFSFCILSCLVLGTPRHRKRTEGMVIHFTRAQIHCSAPYHLAWCCVYHGCADTDRTVSAHLGTRCHEYLIYCRSTIIVSCFIFSLPLAKALAVKALSSPRAQSLWEVLYGAPSRPEVVTCWKSMETLSQTGYPP
jgi:hypothetical protein